MGFLTDLATFLSNINIRYTEKTAALSITKFDHANSFNDVANLLLEIYVPDEVRTIPFSGTGITLDWQNGYPPNSSSTFAEVFGNSPDFTLLQNNGDHTYDAIKEFADHRTKDTDDITLLTVQINASAFTGNWELIINYGTGVGQATPSGSQKYPFDQSDLEQDTDGAWFLPFTAPTGKRPYYITVNLVENKELVLWESLNAIYGFQNNNTQAIEVWVQ